MKSYSIILILLVFFSYYNVYISSDDSDSNRDETLINQSLNQLRNDETNILESNNKIAIYRLIGNDMPPLQKR